MAIGDAVGAFLGTAVEARQPSSGVEELIEYISKQTGSTNNNVRMRDGSQSRNIVDQDQVTDQPADADYHPLEVISVMLTNTNYIQKYGTDDQIFISGIETNA